MVMPPGVVGDGMMKVALLTTFSGSLTATAANAAEDVTCEFTADGFNRGVNEATVTDERLCTTQDGEEPGRYSETLETIYVWDQQNAEDYILYDTLKRGVKGYYLVRYGKPFDQPFVAGDVVDVIQFAAGVQNRQNTPANEKQKIAQKAFIGAGGVTTDLAIDS